MKLKSSLLRKILTPLVASALTLSPIQSQSKEIYNKTQEVTLTGSQDTNASKATPTSKRLKLRVDLSENTETPNPEDYILTIQNQLEIPNQEETWPVHLRTQIINQTAMAVLGIPQQNQVGESIQTIEYLDRYGTLRERTLFATSSGAEKEMELLKKIWDKGIEKLTGPVLNEFLEKYTEKNAVELVDELIERYRQKRERFQEEQIKKINPNLKRVVVPFYSTGRFVGNFEEGEFFEKNATGAEVGRRIIIPLSTKPEDLYIFLKTDLKQNNLIGTQVSEVSLGKGLEEIVLPQVTEGAIIIPAGLFKREGNLIMFERAVSQYPSFVESSPMYPEKVVNRNGTINIQDELADLCVVLDGGHKTYYRKGGRWEKEKMCYKTAGTLYVLGDELTTKLFKQPPTISWELIEGERGFKITDPQVIQESFHNSSSFKFLKTNIPGIYCYTFEFTEKESIVGPMDRDIIIRGHSPLHGKMVLSFYLESDNGAKSKFYKAERKYPPPEILTDLPKEEPPKKIEGTLPQKTDNQEKGIIPSEEEYPIPPVASSSELERIINKTISSNGNSKKPEENLPNRNASPTRPYILFPEEAPERYSLTPLEELRSEGIRKNPFCYEDLDSSLKEEFKEMGIENAKGIGYQIGTNSHLNLVNMKIKRDSQLVQAITTGEYPLSREDVFIRGNELILLKWNLEETEGKQFEEVKQERRKVIQGIKKWFNPEKEFFSDYFD